MLRPMVASYACAQNAADRVCRDGELLYHLSCFLVYLQNPIAREEFVLDAPGDEPPRSYIRHHTVPV